MKILAIFITIFVSSLSLANEGARKPLVRLSEDVMGVVGKNPQIDKDIEEIKGQGFDACQIRDSINGYEVKEPEKKPEFQFSLYIQKNDNKFEAQVLDNADNRFYHHLQTHYELYEGSVTDFSQIVASYESRSIAFVIDQNNGGSIKGSMTTKQDQREPLPEDLNEAAQEISKYMKERFGYDVPNNIVVQELLFQRIKEQPDKINEILNQLNESGAFTSSFSTSDKIDLVAKVGSYLNGDYSFDRSGDQNGARSVDLNPEEMFRRAGDDVDNNGGVCADVAKVQAQMLHQMGIKDYLISYKTLTGRHMNVAIVGHDQDSTRTELLNYGERTATSGVTGVGALNQDTRLPDMNNLSYRVYDYNGRILSQLPSEKTMVIMRAMGIDLPDPFLQDQTNSTVLTANKRLTRSLNLRVHTFAGNTTDGESISGVGATLEHSGKHHEVKAGLSLHHGSFSGHTSETEEVNLLAAVDAKVFDTLATHRFSNGSELSFSGEAGITGLVQTGYGSVRFPGDSDDGASESDFEGFNFDLRGTAAIQARYLSSDKRTEVKGSFRVNSFLATNCESGVYNKDVGLYIDQKLYALEASHKFKDGCKVSVGGIYNDHKLGKGVSLWAGVSKGDAFQAQFGFSRGLSDGPLFYNGNVNKYYANCSFKLSKKVRMNASVTYLEDLDACLIGTEVEVKLK